MKQLCLFLLLLFAIKNGESNKRAADPSKIVKYHSFRRYWTSVDSYQKTYISLNVLKDAGIEPVKIVFPKDKNMTQILSDLTLFSSTTAEDVCKTDNSIFDFKLVFDNENWIRVEVILHGDLKQVLAFLYAKCPHYDSTLTYVAKLIDQNQASFEDNGRTCFTSTNPFHSYNSTKNLMELQVTSTFKCRVSLILPAYMDVEDLTVLPSDTREPVNSTFAAQSEGFWWKSDNDASLSDGIFFLARDVVIDIKKSTKAIPYFLRIGKDQPYPSLKFNLTSCSPQQYDLFINLRESDDCRIRIALTETGIMVTAKGISTEINDPTKSPLLVFARGESKVYVKAGSRLAATVMDVCQIENLPDVPSDQFVLQLVPPGKHGGCRFAQAVVSGRDVNGNIEVLIDRVKAAKLIAQSGLNENGTTVASLVTTTKSAEAGFPWWWILVGVILFLVVVGVVVVVVCCIHRRQRKQKEQKKCQPAKSPVHWDRNSDREYEKIQRDLKTKTAIPVEDSPLKKKKSKKNKKMKMKEVTTEQEIGENKKNEKQLVEEERNNQYEVLPPLLPKKVPPQSPKKPTQDQYSTIQSTHDNPTSETGSTSKKT